MRTNPRNRPQNPYHYSAPQNTWQFLRDRIRMLLAFIAFFALFVWLDSHKDRDVPTSIEQNMNKGEVSPPHFKDTEAQNLPPVNMKVMTFNLRFAGANDGYNSWRFRRTHVADIINRYHPIVMGTQEGLKDQLADLARLLKHPYKRFGVMREENGEFEQIFYDSDIVENLANGDFWLSETPDKPGTIGWDADCVRMVTWGKFRVRQNGQEFYFFNTQLDHVGEKSRIMSSKLLWERIQSIMSTYGPKHHVPMILLGDFNTYRYTSTYKYLTSHEGAGLYEAWPEAKEKIGKVSYTYHAWAGLHHDRERGAKPAANHVDWILYSGKMQVLTAEVITESRNGRYPSDHYPIQAEIVLPQHY